MLSASYKLYPLVPSVALHGFKYFEFVTSAKVKAEPVIVPELFNKNKGTRF